MKPPDPNPNLHRRLCPTSTHTTTMNLLLQKHTTPKATHYRHYLLLLSISLSLYLLLTSTSLHSPLPSSPRLHPHHHRHLHTSKPTTNSQPSTSHLLIYIYNLPPSFNTHWLTNPRCNSHLFASEVALHLAIADSPFHTTDPSRANLFFVPVYVSCDFNTTNGFPSLAHARPLLSSAVDLISTNHPFWNRSGGSDHVFVASHDYGSCFHAMEDAAIAHGIPAFLKSSIILQTFGVNGPHPCQDVAHVLIPPYIPPEEALAFDPARPKRDIFAFFRGKMEVHPKNISGHFYGKGLRTEIWRRYSGDRRFYLRRKRFEGYRTEIARSVFCLCPIGWAPWSPRLVESVAFGCVPVIIADGIRLPFSDTVPWSDISISIPEARIDEMGKVLGHVAKTNLTVVQRNLWKPEVRRALLYNRRMTQGDATWLTVKALEKMVGSWTQAVISE